MKSSSNMEELQLIVLHLSWTALYRQNGQQKENECCEAICIGAYQNQYENVILINAMHHVCEKMLFMCLSNHKSIGATLPSTVTERYFGSELKEPSAAAVLDVERYVMYDNMGMPVNVNVNIPANSTKLNETVMSLSS